VDVEVEQRVALHRLDFLVVAITEGVQGDALHSSVILDLVEHHAEHLELLSLAGLLLGEAGVEGLQARAELV